MMRKGKHRVRRRSIKPPVLRVAVCGLTLAVVAAACGDADPATVSSTVPSGSTIGSIDEPGATGGTPPTTLRSSDEPLVYVAMGDSVTIRPGSPDGAVWRYAELLKQRSGVDIDIRLWARGSLSTTTLLFELRTNEALRTDLAEADVVTTDIPMDVWIRPMQTAVGWDGNDPADCGGTDNRQCLRDALAKYEADTDAIIDEIVALTSPGAEIRLLDLYMIKTGFKLETGTLDIVNPYWKEGMDHVEESAARYGIPVAQVYDSFMGPTGTDDPFVKGLLANDERHANDQGAKLIAELLYGLDT